MTAKYKASMYLLKPSLIAAVATAATLGAMPKASAYTVQAINAPGWAVRMSGNESVVGNYISTCANINTQFDHAKYCYTSPWLFDGKNIAKLVNAFPSGTVTSGVAINNTRMVVGVGGPSTGGGSWLYSAGVVTYTGPLVGAPCTTTTLSAINNLGTAVGSTCYGRSVTFQGGSLTLVQFSDPALVGAAQANAIDINDSGWITGWFKGTDGIERTFVRSGAGVDTIIANPTGVTGCRPVRISQVNAATGQVWVAENCSGRPFIYNFATSALTELTFAGSSNLSVVSINSQGVAVGSAIKPGAFAPDGYTAILWPAGSASSTVPTDLNANPGFAPIGAWNLHATDINDLGTVLTGCNDSKGNFYTFLLRL